MANEPKITTEEQADLNKIILESVCIVHALLDDYCNEISVVKDVSAESVKERILQNANENLKVLKERFL